MPRFRASKLSLTMGLALSICLLNVGVKTFPNQGAPTAQKVTTVDFSSQPLGSQSRSVQDPYQQSGITFTPDHTADQRVSDEVVGLVTNGATSACVNSKSRDNQVLGTGRRAFSNGDVGKFGFPIEANFGTPLTPSGSNSVSVAVDVQSLVEAQVELQLFGPNGNVVTTRTQTINTPAGTCGNPGDPRGVVTMTATAQQAVASARISITEDQVFVIDDVQVQGQSRNSGGTVLSPILNSLNPSTANPGDTISITGQHFLTSAGPNKPRSAVWWDGGTNLVDNTKVISSTKIEFKVPSDASCGPHDIAIGNQSPAGTSGTFSSAKTLQVCGEQTSKITAPPVGLPSEAAASLSLPKARFETMREAVSLSEGGERQIISPLVVHEFSESIGPELPVRFSKPAPTARKVVVLSTPSTQDKENLMNPKAQQTLEEVANGEIGRRLLEATHLVSSQDFQWERGPKFIGERQADMLGGTLIESYFGVIAEPEGQGKAVLMNLAHLQDDNNVIIMGYFQGRQLASETLGTGEECATVKCQVEEADMINFQKKLGNVGGGIQYCPPGIKQISPEGLCPVQNNLGDDDDDDDEGGSNLPPKDERVHIKLKNVRLVQEVENTAVVNPNTSNTIHSEADPDLVSGEGTSVVFELTGFKNLNKLSQPVKVQITRPSQGGASTTSESFNLSPQDIRDIKNGTSTISVLHRNANDGNPANDNPVFSLFSPNPTKIDVEVAPFDMSIIGELEEAANHKSSNIKLLRPLRVGFMQVRDPGKGSNYGDSNGYAEDYRRSVNSAVEYLQQVYPGDVVAYAAGIYLWGNSQGQWRKDLKQVKTVLDQLASTGRFNQAKFSGGRIINDTDEPDSRVKSNIRQNGFDVTVAVVPDNVSSNSQGIDYFGHHWDGAVAGVFANHNKAVAFEGAGRSGPDQWASVVNAQEVGHYFQQSYKTPSGHPMAQRDDGGSSTTVNGVPVDPAHARHQGSDLRDVDANDDGDFNDPGDTRNPPDPPGVISTGYALENGTFANVQSFTVSDGNFSVSGPGSNATTIGRLSSYMSYDNPSRSLWADARIHQQLIDGEWSWPNQAGSDNSSPMLTALVSLPQGEGVEGNVAGFEDVVAYQGFNRYVNHEDGSVLIELLGPEGEVLEQVRVPDHLNVSHGDDIPGRTSFNLPFREGVVSVRLNYQGQTLRMNPIVRSVKDAVRRVPDRGLQGDPESARETIFSALENVASAMADGAYEQAASAMDTDVRTAITEALQAYEGGINQPTEDRLLRLVDTMLDRLKGLSSGPTGGSNQPSQSGVRTYDADGDCRLGDGEFFTLVDNWIVDEVSDRLFFEGVDAWVAETNVCRSGTSSAGQGLTLATVGTESPASGNALTFQAIGQDIVAMQVEVYGLSGDHIFSRQTAGTRLQWDLTTSEGTPLANGVYLYRLTVEGPTGDVQRSKIKKLIVLR